MHLHCKKRKNQLKILFVSIMTLTSLIFLYSPITLFVNAQPIDNQSSIPVILIHGYASDSSVWVKWEKLLENSNIPYLPVTFDNSNGYGDGCGSSLDHATELDQIIKDFKVETNSSKVNIVAHSKGGLDARTYLGNNSSNDSVVNLVMLGPPNKGSPLADRDYEIDPCKPAVYDLMTNSTAIISPINNNTNYYTIAGNWEPSYIPFTFIDSNCSLTPWYSYLKEGSSFLEGPDDGIVPLGSAQPPEFIPLGQTDNCHTDLLSGEEYDLALQVLK